MPKPWSRYFTSQFRSALRRFTMADAWVLFQRLPVPLRMQVENCLKSSPEGLAIRYLSEQPRLKERRVMQAFWPRELIDAMNIPETLPPLPPAVMSQLLIQRSVALVAPAVGQKAPVSAANPAMTPQRIIDLPDLKKERRLVIPKTVSHRPTMQPLALVELLEPPRNNRMPGKVRLYPTF